MRSPRRWRRLTQLGQSEVQDFDKAVVPDHDVLGLDVAVHNARFVGRT
jgi:hypothetical protein